MKVRIMKATKLSRRVLGLLLVLPVLLALCFTAYTFGPSPSQPVNAVAPPETPATAAKSTVLDRVAPANSLLELFGMYQTAVAKGRVAMTPTEYLNSLQVIYEQRGYHPLTGHQHESRKERRKAPAEPVAFKFFQRDEADGIGNFSATGIDADYNSDKLALEPYTFSTIVAPAEGGGADWASYRIEVDRNQLAKLSKLGDEDFPGTDPLGVPRLPGLQRIYSLTSGSGSVAIYKSKEPVATKLMGRYLHDMQRDGWRLDSTATADANKVASGAMFFSRGPRSCLIWVTPGKEAGGTNVTISSH